jgi:hypothetical protein
MHIRREKPIRITSVWISGVLLYITDIWALLGHYGAYSGNSIPKFRDNISVPSSRVKKVKTS